MIVHSSFSAEALKKLVKYNYVYEDIFSQVMMTEQVTLTFYAQLFFPVGSLFFSELESNQAETGVLLKHLLQTCFHKTCFEST